MAISKQILSKSNQETATLFAVVLQFYSITNIIVSIPQSRVVNLKFSVFILVAIKCL